MSTRNSKIAQKKIADYLDKICNEYCKYNKDNKAICEGCPQNSILRTVNKENVGEYTTGQFITQMTKETLLNSHTIAILMESKGTNIAQIFNILCSDFNRRKKDSVLRVLMDYLDYSTAVKHLYNPIMLHKLTEALQVLYGDVHAEIEPDITPHIDLIYKTGKVPKIYAWQEKEIISILRSNYVITGHGIATYKNGYPGVTYKYEDYGKTWAFRKEELSPIAKKVIRDDPD